MADLLEKRASTRCARAVALGAVLLSAVALGGCGSGAASGEPDPKIQIKSAGIAGTTLPARYTCDGHDTAPPLEWGAVPTTVGELVLLVVGYRPEPATNTTAISVEWAVAGLKPSLHSLVPGRLPAGAYVGKASNGKRHYSICPKKGTVVQYQFELYGVPKAASVSRKFTGIAVLSALTGHNSRNAAAHGAFYAIYKRL